MREFDRTKTLEELEEDIWGEPEYDSHLVTECHRLRKKRVCDFDIENLRIMIGQEIGMDYLVPIALEFLKENPLVQGDFYPGDLLNNVLKINFSFWEENHDLKETLDLIIQDTPLVPEIEESLNSYLKSHKAIHECSEMMIGDNFKFLIYKIIDNWYLSSITYADGKAVSDGEAERIGEIMNEYSFLIKFCPFCGMKL